MLKILVTYELLFDVNLRTKEKSIGNIQYDIIYYLNIIY